ncbi:MAG: hypothetical protein KJ858_04005, partial [Nanoarchaeota archaeon]|nr:hypothetical protein [Nanoarchaeota archaeon]
MPEIISDILPPEATQYLNEIQTPTDQETPEQIAQKEMMIGQAKGELLSWCKDFINKSKDWRSASFEDKWRLYQNNCDSIMESSIKDAKEPWQSKGFVPLTASHKEAIHAHIVRVIAGVKPPLAVEPRFD